jgi:general secretion pathway protein C
MFFDQWLKRNFWVVFLPVVAIAAFFHAQGVTELIGTSFVPDDKQLAAPPPQMKTAPLAQGNARTTSADSILARNPFDHVTGPLHAPAVAVDTVAGGNKEPDTTDPMSAPSCDGLKVLVIAASSDPEWSFAAFSKGGGDTKTTLLRRGGDAFGKKVTFIGWDRVWLDNGGSLCQAQLFAAPAAKPSEPAPAASVVTATKPASGAPGVPPEIAKGIVKISATEFNIDRGVVDKILENQADLMRQARIVPEMENGKTVGIKMYGIRPDTLLGTLGMENGDRLQTINGFEMASPEKALEAYAHLRTSDALAVKVTRRGAPVTIDFKIQ